MEMMEKKENLVLKGQKGDKGVDGSVGTTGDKGQKGEAGAGGGAQVSISDTAPGSASNGDLWWESDTFDLHVYYADGSSNQWVSITSNAALKVRRVLQVIKVKKVKLVQLEELDLMVLKVIKVK